MTFSRVDGKLWVGTGAGAQSMSPVEFCSATDAGVAITAEGELHGTESYIAAFLKNSNNQLFKAGAMAWQVSDGNTTNGFSSWNIHTTYYTNGVSRDWVGFTSWGRNGCAFNPWNLTSAPGPGIVRFNVAYGTGVAALQLAPSLTPPTADGFMGIYVDATDGNLKVKLPNGTIKTVVLQ